MAKTNRADLDSSSLWKTREKYKKPPREHTIALVKASREGDIAATQTLLKQNVGLIFRYAKKYPVSNVTFEDLVQEGGIGLLTAIEKFDSENFNTEFSTLAGWWIHQSIRRAAKSQRMIHIPEGRLQKVFKLNRLVQQADQVGVELEEEYLAKRLRINKLEKLEDLRRCPLSVSSLKISSWKKGNDVDQPQEQEETDIPDSFNLEEEIERIEEGRALRAALRRLPETLRTVVEAKFGLSKEFPKPITFTKLSSVLGCTTGKAKKLVDSGVRELRKILCPVV